LYCISYCLYAYNSCFFEFLEALKFGKYGDKEVNDFQIVIEGYVRRTTERMRALESKRKQAAELQAKKASPGASTSKICDADGEQCG